MLEAGKQFRHYHILHKLGAGGMGEVYLAQDGKLRRHVALKVLPKNLSFDNQANERLLREAQAAAMLDHPNICAIHEISEAEDFSFIVMQYVEGDTLSEKLEKERLSVETSLNSAIQIADALAEAHAHNVIHRDIKPANIIINKKGQAKVLDFGLAKFVKVESEEETVQMLSAAGAIMGTVPYMSPEQACGKQLDARSDIFSFGAMFYEMLCGRQPFARDNQAETISAILNDEPSFDEIPARLRPIVRKSLVKDKDERYQTAQVLTKDLREAQRGGAISHTTDSQFWNAGTVALPKIPTRDIAPERTQRILSNRRFLLPILASLILVFVATMGFFAYRYFSAAPKNSIAVLPLVNASQDASNEYLSDGITESIINNLSQLSGLKVMSRNSSFRFKNNQTDTKDIASQLGVETIVTGDIKQIGDKLVINVRLINADDSQIWGNQYVKTSSNVIAAQTEIAQAVAQNLRLKLTNAEQQQLVKRPTENDEAYQLYLRGHFLQYKITPQDLFKSIEYYNQAIALDPNFALAYVGLAESTFGLTAFRDIPRQNYKQMAREYAVKALTLDDQLPEAHATIGSFLLMGDYDFAGAEREYNRALELNPNYAEAHLWRGLLLSSLGRHEEAFAEIRRAMELDPMSLEANSAYGGALFFARRYDESIEHLQKVLGLDANYFPAHRYLAFNYEMKGDYAARIAESVKINEITGSHQRAEAMKKSFERGGWQGFLRDATVDNSPLDLHGYLVATFCAELGEKDKAFAILEKLYEERNGELVLIKVDPRLDNLRDDPRFQDLMRRVGLTD
jgi:serine/threonine-protein kinase